MVAKSGACVQARIRQFYSLDLQLAIVDACVLSIHNRNMVFGPVYSMEGVLGRATQIQTIPTITGELLCLRFRRGYKESRTQLLATEQAPMVNNVFISDFQNHKMSNDMVCVLHMSVWLSCWLITLTPESTTKP